MPDERACFEYDGRQVEAAVFDSDFGPGIGFECPECHTWGLILHSEAEFIVGGQSNLSVERPVGCRDRSCDWLVEIQDGVATDLDVSHETSEAEEPMT